MPKKYHLETSPTPARHLAPGPSSILDWEEGCRKCHRCVRWQCPYGVYLHRDVDPFSLADTADSLCKHCFQCVQSCPMRLVSQAVNPEYTRLGDDYWTPDVLSRIYYQAETGLIPVSGAGYGGPFTGPGFDAMWTDMSEIVRPTRDGIHGREYISTAVDLGRKPEFVRIEPGGGWSETDACFVESPLPFILGLPQGRRLSPPVVSALAGAAEEMRAFCLIPYKYLNDLPKFSADFTALHLNREQLDLDPADFRRFPLVQADEADGVEAWVKRLKNSNPGQIVMVRLPFGPGVQERLEPLIQAGADIFHLWADAHGRQPGLDGPDEAKPFLKEMLREIHMTLVDLGLRDRVTLLVSGGLALAEHTAKAIVCGADAVVLDLALWAALECRLCPDCLDRRVCPVELETVPLDWAVRRLKNLMGAWRNQLLEVLGAMGLREIRRLRGEVGRAMFFEQLEEESFAPIFGWRKGQSLK